MSRDAACQALPACCRQLPLVQEDVVIVQAMAAALSQPLPEGAAALTACTHQTLAGLLHTAHQAAQAFAQAPQPADLGDSRQLAASEALLRGLQRLKAVLSACSSYAGQLSAAAAQAAQQPSLGQCAIQVRTARRGAATCAPRLAAAERARACRSWVRCGRAWQP